MCVSLRAFMDSGGHSRADLTVLMRQAAHPRSPGSDATITHHVSIITYHRQIEVRGHAVIIHPMSWSCVDQTSSLHHGYMVGWQQRHKAVRHKRVSADPTLQLGAFKKRRQLKNHTPRMTLPVSKTTPLPCKVQWTCW